MYMDLAQFQSRLRHNEWHNLGFKSSVLINILWNKRAASSVHIIHTTHLWWKAVMSMRKLGKFAKKYMSDSCDRIGKRLEEERTSAFPRGTKGNHVWKLRCTSLRRMPLPGLNWPSNGIEKPCRIWTYILGKGLKQLVIIGNYVGQNSSYTVCCPLLQSFSSFLKSPILAQPMLWGKNRIKASFLKNIPSLRWRGRIGKVKWPRYKTGRNR